MNTRKITVEKKKDLLLLYKQGIPTSILASVFETAVNTALANLPLQAKDDAKDFKEPASQKKLRLLKLYAWLVTDESDCVAGIGTPYVIAAKPFLFSYLRLTEWERVIEGIILYKNNAERNRYADDVSEGHKKLLEGMLPSPKIAVSPKKILNRMLTMMHDEEIPFPLFSDIDNPSKSLVAFVEKELIVTERFVRFFDAKVANYLDALIESKLSLRDAAIVRAAFDISDTGVTEVASAYNLSKERVMQVARRTCVYLGVCLEKKFRSVGEFIEHDDSLEKIKNTLSESSKELEIARALSENQAKTMTLLARYIGKGYSVLDGEMEENAKDSTSKISTPLRALLQTPIDDLRLSVRASNCLNSKKIKTLAQLVEYEPEDLMRIRDFGEKSLHEIQELLAKKGLSLGMTI